MKKLLMLLLLLTSSENAFTSVSKWVDFELNYGHIYIPVVINGVETHALLDTGSQLNGINTNLIEKNDFALEKAGKVNVRGVFGVSEKQMYNDVIVELFGLRSRFNGITEIDLGHHSKGMLLGASFLSAYIIQIDYPKNRIRLISRDALDLTDSKNLNMKKLKGSGEPVVRIEIGDRKLWFLFDTGSTGGLMVERNVANSLNLSNDERRLVGQSSGINSSGDIETTLVNDVRFGPFLLDDVPITFAAEGVSTNLTKQYGRTGTLIKSKKVQGILGYQVLKHFIVTFDYKLGHTHIGLPPEE